MSYILMGIIIKLYFIIHSYFNSLVQNTGHEFYKNRTNVNIYDIIHVNFPNYEQYELMTNVIALCTLVPLIHKYNKEIFFKFVKLLLIIYSIRDITINLTILPKNEICLVKTDTYSHIVGSCYDKIFSGHFAFVYILSLLYYSNKYITNIPVLVGWNILNGFVIIITRSHYTNDVIVSFFICSYVYNIFDR